MFVITPVFQLYVVAPVAVHKIFVPEQIVGEFTDIVGVGLIISVAVLFEATPQAPAGTVYVTTYVPVVLDPKFTEPEVALKLKPTGVAENVPPVVNPEAKEGVGTVPFKQ